MGRLTGSRLGQYELVEVLGRGGMATVYRAYQPSLGRDVALKVLHEHLDGQAGARFEREARAVARLQHPNILPVYDYGEDDGRRYIVTQFVPGGRTLAHLAAAGPVEPGRAIALAERVLDALGHAHRSGVIHRDIKPANIMLPRDEWPMLADFGIAEVLSATTQLTPVGQIIGTPAYMAPERASDGPADPRSDLYAMGVVLYELLAGQPPFDGDSALAVVMKHLADEPPPLPLLAPGVPPALADVVHTALAKKPDERFQSAETMAAALGRVKLDIRQGTEKPAPASSSPAPLLEARQMGEPRTVVVPGPGRAPATPPVQPGAAPVRAGAASVPPAVSGGAGRRGTWLAALVVILLVAAVGWVVLGAGGGAGSPAPAGGGVAVRLDDEAWEGGWGGAGAPRSYGGRSAVWVYGQGTGYSEMRASFELADRPTGRALLTVEGMDGEGPVKAEIRITVNGSEIYRGPSPLPDDDYDPATGTWGSHSWTFDAGLLQGGRNLVAITNLSPGQFSAPPFVMLDYADVRVEE